MAPAPLHRPRQASAAKQHPRFCLGCRRRLAPDGYMARCIACTGARRDLAQVALADELVAAHGTILYSPNTAGHAR